MDSRKNWFTYIYLTIFSVCMGFTLFSGILNIGSSTPYPFLWYGGVIATMGLLCLLIKFFTFLLPLFDLRRLKSQNKKLKIIIESIFVIAVLVAGAGLRIWVIQNMPIVPTSDYKTYYDVATLLSQGNLIKDGVGLCNYISEFPHVIGYPYILSKVFGIFGVSVSVGLYFNMAISLISIFLAYRIARLICGKVGGLIALTLVAFWPSQILYINHLASEPVFTCMVLLSIWLAVYLFKYPFANGKASVCLLLNLVLGVSLAIGGAIRPMSIILLIAIIICIFPSKIKLNKDKDSVGLIESGMSKGWIRVLVIIISYILFLQIVSGAITRTIDRELPGSSVSFGYNLLVGLNIDSKGAWNEQDAKLLNDKFLETDSAAEALKSARKEALKRIQKDPIGIANLLLEKYTLLWKNDDYAAYWNLLSMQQQNTLTPERKALFGHLVLWNNLYYLLCVLFSTLAGIALWFRKKVGAEHILILLFIGTAILHMILESQNRYHYDILPLFAILTAVGSTEIYRYFTKKPGITNIDQSFDVQQELVATQEELVAVQEELGATEEQPLKQQGLVKENDNKFDMINAIKDGHVIVTVSEAYLKK
jgi:hypothetical protein